MPSKHTRRMIEGGLLAAAFLCASLSNPGSNVAAQDSPRSFPTPDAAARELIRIVKAGNLQELITLLGKDGQELADGADPVVARKNREVFKVATAERWRLVDEGNNRTTLVVGNEDWPFPIPIVGSGTAYHFDTAAGKEEVIARRIGGNELGAIAASHTYVTAQESYAKQAHDGKPSGLYAKTFSSDTGRQNGLYWPVKRGEPRSPLGEQLAEAAELESKAGASGAPNTFHGYHFKILTEQGAAAAGGAKSYVVKGEMSGGFALVAWPAQYDVTGVMTFIVNQDGVLYQKDLGDATDSAAKAMTTYNPDASWHKVD